MGQFLQGMCIHTKCTYDVNHFLMHKTAAIILVLLHVHSLYSLVLCEFYEVLFFTPLPQVSHAYCKLSNRHTFIQHPW